MLHSSGPILELPEDPTFISEPPRFSADEMFRMNQRLLKFYNSIPGIADARLWDKCDVPFVL
ncbi:MAG: hypothetical protein JWR69_285 [Pedosphaera sp.]|nr:hypothetical protein [Pedosphaera sp.]